MNEEEINNAVANGKYIANIYGEGSIGYYKVYSMIDVISKLQKENDTLKTTINKQSKDISEQLKELDKKDKVIELMAFELAEITGSCPADIYETYMNCDNRECNTKECIKEYFYKKVEEENVKD